MKIKLLTFLFLTAGILPSQAASTISWDFGGVYVNGSGALADGKAVYLIASTSGADINLTSLQSSLVGVSLSQGSTFGSDLIVLGTSTPNFSSFGAAGTGNATSSNIFYNDGLSAGDSLGLLWIDQADGVIGSNVKFGIYISPTLTMPSDPSTITEGISFLEEQYGGTIADGTLTTTNITAVPEPSAILLSALGVFGLLLRRKR